MSVKYNITSEVLQAAGFRVLHAGDDYNHSFTVERPAGTPLVLTGATLWLTVKDDTVVPDAEAKLQLVSTDSDQIEITDAVAGKFTVKFSSAGAKTTENLEGTWGYDVQVKLASSVVMTLLRGDIQFLPSTTRSIS